ncbi:MAG: RluA family pseudouridine synthase [Victivallaceae bacterium]|nr:RluA family pseudouridine synthase [Victivallaceae bacterium]
MPTYPELEHRIVCTKVTDRAGTLLEFLAGRFTYHSKDEWRDRIISGVITLNGGKTAPDTVPEPGDIIEYHVGELAEPPVDSQYSIVYEDDSLLVVDKSGNLPCHPAGPFYHNTLWFQLMRRYGAIYLVNRLDRETSGLVLAARTSQAAAFYAKQLPQMEKTYTALVYGDFASERDADGFIEYDPESTVRKKRRFVAAPSSPSAQTAKTKLRPLARTTEFSLVEAILATGRTHQIRATLFSLGFPLVGDKLYGPDDTIFLRNRTDELTTEDRKKLILPRQALHARKLTLRNTAGKRLSFESPAPDFLAEAAAFRADLKRN